MPADIWPVGHFMKQEMNERGIGVRAVAEESGLSVKDIQDVYYARCRIRRHVAEGLSRAFGTSVELWEEIDRLFWDSLEAQLNKTHLG